MNMSGGFIWEYDMKTVLRQYNIEKNETCITGTVHLYHESYNVEDTMHTSAKFFKYIILY